MADFDEGVTASGVQLMQGLAQRVTAGWPELVNADASFGELAWIWGHSRSVRGHAWTRGLWFSGGGLVAWGWGTLPHQVTRSDGSVREVRGSSLAHQVHPDYAGLIDEVIEWFEAAALLWHGMHRARDAGATAMTVASLGAPGHPAAKGLYDSVGFRAFSRDVPLVKAEA